MMPHRSWLKMFGLSNAFVETFHQQTTELTVDRKTKKKLEVLRKKLGTLRQQLAGVRRQTDDPSEVERLAAETSKVEEEMKKLKENS